MSCTLTNTNIGNYDIKFYVGDDEDFTFIWKVPTEITDSEGEVTIELLPVNLTGWSSDMHVKETIDGVTELTKVGVVVGVEGKTTYSFTSVELRTLFGTAYLNKEYIYDVQMTDPSTKKDTILVGKLLLRNDITQI